MIVLFQLGIDDDLSLPNFSMLAATNPWATPSSARSPNRVNTYPPFLFTSSTIFSKSERRSLRWPRVCKIKAQSGPVKRRPTAAAMPLAAPVISITRPSISPMTNAQPVQNYSAAARPGLSE